MDGAASGGSGAGLAADPINSPLGLFQLAQSISSIASGLQKIVVSLSVYVSWGFPHHSCAHHHIILTDLESLIHYCIGWLWAVVGDGACCGTIR